MRQVHFEQVMILSAEKANLSGEENSQRTFNLQRCLDDLNIGYTSAIGVYKRSVETSLVVVLNNNVTIQVLLDLAFINFDQESVLYQDNKGESYLINKIRDREHIGKLRKVHKNVARSKDSYTCMGDNYYSIVA